MSKDNQLPTVKNRKAIDPEKLTSLAKKVRKYFEEESKYIKEQHESYGYNKANKLSPTS